MTGLLCELVLPGPTSPNPNDPSPSLTDLLCELVLPDPALCLDSLQLCRMLCLQLAHLTVQCLQSFVLIIRDLILMHDLMVSIV